MPVAFFKAAIACVACVVLVSGRAVGEEEDVVFAKVNVLVVNSRNQLELQQPLTPVQHVEQLQLTWLLNQSLPKELDLTSDQIAGVKNLSKRLDVLDDLMVSISKIQSEQPVDAAGLRRGHTEISALRAEIAKELGDLLLPSQQRRLAQLRLRQAIAETGFDSVLAGEVAESLRLDGRQSEDVQKMIGKVRAVWKGRRDQQVRELLTDVTRLLSNDQRRVLEREVGDVAEYLTPAFELLIWQLRNPVEDRVPFETRLDEYFRGSHTYVVTLCGQVDEHGMPFGSLGMPLRQILLGQAYGRVELVDFQRWQMPLNADENAKRRAKAEQQISDARRELFQQQISFEEFVAVMVEAVQAHEIWLAETWFSELLPEQRDEIERVLLRRSIANRGIHHCLINGMLGNLLEVTPLQRMTIAEQMEARASKAAEAAIGMEREIWAAMRTAYASNGRAA